MVFCTALRAQCGAGAVQGTWQRTTLVQDGSTNVDRNYGSTLIVQPNLDSIQEVKVETSVSDAKYSSPATAVVTTKSGTNEPPGSLFETAINTPSAVRQLQFSARLNF
jgi:hypothetical protein